MSAIASAAPATPRAEALARLDGLVYPTKRDEAWRYAPHRLLAELTFGPAGDVPAGDVPAELDERIPVLGGPCIVVVDGVVDPERSNLTELDGVRVSTLAAASADRADLVRQRFERPDDVGTDAFTALNLAYGVDGAVIEVDDGVTLDVPIHVVDIALSGATSTASCTGVVIRLGAHSSATVVETRLGAGDTLGGSNVHTSITIGADATLEHIVLQDLSSSQVHLGRVEITQGERSIVHARSFNLGAAYGRLAYHVQLAGVGAFADLSGLFFGGGDQILDQQITVIHAEQDGTSRQSYRGVLDGASTGVFNGGIDVRPGADGTDASQSNDNLLLSNRAEVNTQPRLEILADEVACKHGATVGQLDDTALYYLRSRGINAADAQRLLVNGFADQMVDDVGVDAIRTWVTHRLGHDRD